MAETKTDCIVLAGAGVPFWERPLSFATGLFLGIEAQLLPLSGTYQICSGLARYVY
jgi:hypothetical protein